MAKVEKLLERLLSNPTDFTWTEVLKVLRHFGYYEVKTGKTSGSSRRFSNEHKEIILLHEPHPGNILKHYQLKKVVRALKERGKIKDE